MLPGLRFKKETVPRTIRLETQTDVIQTRRRNPTLNPQRLMPTQVHSVHHTTNYDAVFEIRLPKRKPQTPHTMKQLPDETKAATDRTTRDSPAAPTGRSHLAKPSHNRHKTATHFL